MTYNTHLLRHLRFIIGRNIHKERVKQKLTLRKLAKITEIPESLLDHYELGKNDISLLELLKITCALQTDISKMIK